MSSDDPADVDWTSVPISELIANLIEVHHPHTVRLLQQMRLSADALDREVIDAVEILHEVITRHQQLEESRVFPLSQELDRAAHLECPPEIDGSEAMHVMTRGHGDIRCALGALEQAVDRQLDRRLEQDMTAAFSVKKALDALKADLSEHGWKEDEILLPALIFAQDLISAKRRSQNVDAIPATTSESPRRGSVRTSIRGEAGSTTISPSDSTTEEAGAP